MDVMATGLSLVQEGTLPPQYMEAWRHLVNCYKQCWEIAQSSQGVEFPLVLKSNWTPSPSSTLTTTNKAAMSIHMSDLSTTTSLGPTTTSNPKTETLFSRHGVLGNFSSPCRPSIDRASNYGSLSTHSAQRRPFGCSSLSDAGIGWRQRPQNVSQPQVRFLEKVGWCLQTSSTSTETEFTMLFNDGARMHIESSVDGAACFVRYTEDPSANDATLTRFAMDKRLPNHVKQRLLYFPHFVQLFQSS